MTIEVQERDNYRDDIHCPFCNQLVFNQEKMKINSCQHTLFIAHDHGFEFCDLRTKKNLKISENEDLENYGEFLETGMDEFLRGVDMAGSIMIAVYVPAPSFFGSYYGFVN